MQSLRLGAMALFSGHMMERLARCTAPVIQVACRSSGLYLDCGWDFAPKVIGNCWYTVCLLRVFRNFRHQTFFCGSLRFEIALHANVFACKCCLHIRTPMSESLSKIKLFLGLLSTCSPRHSGIIITIVVTICVHANCRLFWMSPTQLYWISQSWHPGNCRTRGLSQPLRVELELT